MVWRICKHVQWINVNKMLINCITEDFQSEFYFDTFFFGSMTPTSSSVRPLLADNVKLHIVIQIIINAFLLRAAGFSLCSSPHRHKWNLFRSGLTEAKVSTIWTRTSETGAKKRPMSAQMGKSSLAGLLWVWHKRVKLLLTNGQQTCIQSKLSAAQTQDALHHWN